MNHPYTVALVVDAVELPAAARIEAEKRYASTLERNLGGPDEVAAVLKAWQAVNDSALEDIDQLTAETAIRWPRAADQAQQAAMRPIGELPGAHFEVRLGRG
jgi:hypothetical protein